MLSPINHRPRQPLLPRRKGPALNLRIDTPASFSTVIQVDSSASASASVSASASASASALSSAGTEPEDTPAAPLPAPPMSKPRPSKNTKRLSLQLAPIHVDQQALPPDSDLLSSDPPRPAFHQSQPQPQRPRRPSIISLPNPAASTRLHRKDEDDSPTAPYVDGPIEILPSIWLGSEENVHDWASLTLKGIKSVLNVAKEVNGPFEAGSSAQPLRNIVSTPNLKETFKHADSTYYPAHAPSGRPPMHYLKLPWSHGQSDLVQEGFPSAMAFVDAARERGDGVLIHCQCGVSRSATVVIALVMRAAYKHLPNVPSEVWALRGMHNSYDYVKSKSKAVGPNMSLIYQLLEYERVLNSANHVHTDSERSSPLTEEEEWNRQRLLLDETPSDVDVDSPGRESLAAVRREADALDKAMEERIVSRKTSSSSMASSTGMGMGMAWKSRFGLRARAPSVTSNRSLLSEDLVEEDEERELLGVGGGFDGQSVATRSPETEPSEGETPFTSKEHLVDSALPSNPETPLTARPRKSSGFKPPQLINVPPPSAPATKSSFGFLPRFGAKGYHKRRPPSIISTLPPVPSSPVVPVDMLAHVHVPRTRKESGKPPPPPLKLLSTSRALSHLKAESSALSTPSQTLFVFPPSPTLMARTPSTVTITSFGSSIPFPAVQTPRVSTFKAHGRSRSFIGLQSPVIPTTASSRVDARGWFERPMGQ